MGETGVSVDEFLAIVLALPEVDRRDHANTVGFKVCGKGFGYLVEAGPTVLLKATRAEQAALVGENPEAYGLSHTSGRFGWVEVRLSMVPRDELVELATEAWYLTAPKRLTAGYGLGG